MGVSSSNGFTVSDTFTNHATCKIVIFAIVIDSSKLLIIVAKSSILNGFEVPPLQCIIFVLYPSKLKKKSSNVFLRIRQSYDFFSRPEQILLLLYLFLSLRVFI